MNTELINDLNSVLEKHGWKYRFGNSLQKTKGAEWHGTVCGIYFTELTKEGYAVNSTRETGSVQVYPEHALEIDI
mgnify:CR=1 FL=1